MNDYAQPITLSSQADWTSGTTFTVTGWGTLSVSMDSKHSVNIKMLHIIFFSQMVPLLRSFKKWMCPLCPKMSAKMPTEKKTLLIE